MKSHEELVNPLPDEFDQDPAFESSADQESTDDQLDPDQKVVSSESGESTLEIITSSELDRIDPEQLATQVIEVLNQHGTDFEVIKDKLPHSSELTERGNQVEHLRVYGYFPIVALPKFYTEGQSRVSKNGQVATEAGYDNKVANEIIERLNEAGYEARIKFSHEDVPFKGHWRFPFICLSESSTGERSSDARAA